MHKVNTQHVKCDA